MASDLSLRMSPKFDIRPLRVKKRSGEWGWGLKSFKMFSSVDSRCKRNILDVFVRSMTSTVFWDWNKHSRIRDIV